MPQGPTLQCLGRRIEPQEVSIEREDLLSGGDHPKLRGIEIVQAVYVGGQLLRIDLDLPHRAGAGKPYYSLSLLRVPGFGKLLPLLGHRDHLHREGRTPAFC